jgi:hypothetical protein
MFLQDIISQNWRQHMGHEIAKLPLIYEIQKALATPKCKLITVAILTWLYTFFEIFPSQDEVSFPSLSVGTVY